jgi:hypothetical protein
MVQAPEPLIECMEAISPNAVFEIPIVDLIDPSSDDLGHLFPLQQ